VDFEAQGFEQLLDAGAAGFAEADHVGDVAGVLGAIIHGQEEMLDGAVERHGERAPAAPRDGTVGQRTHPAACANGDQAQAVEPFETGGDAIVRHAERPLERLRLPAVEDREEEKGEGAVGGEDAFLGEGEAGGGGRGRGSGEIADVGAGERAQRIEPVEGQPPALEPAADGGFGDAEPGGDRLAAEAGAAQLGTQLGKKRGRAEAGMVHRKSWEAIICRSLCYHDMIGCQSGRLIVPQRGDMQGAIGWQAWAKRRVALATTADYGLGEFTFPRGWFMVAPSGEATGAPKPLRMFGRDLVIYRGESGRVVLMDAYCPHMQAHLAAEQTSGAAARRIEGDAIRCPYHGWRFGPDGRCDHVPYYKGPMPPAAKVRSFPVEERFGCVFAWHDPEEGAPDYALPELPEWDDPYWVRCTFDDLGTIPVHPQEIIDNIGDTRHFGPIHGQIMAYFDNIFDGVTARQRSGGGHETLTSSEDGVLESDAMYTGPGILIARYSGETDAVQIILHTPKEDGVTQIWHGLITRGQSVPHSPADLELNRSYHDLGLAAFSQDFAIWRTKGPAIHILRLPTDGPFPRSRAWYRQFYNPRARAAEYQARANGLHRTQDVPPHPSEQAA